MTSRFSSIGRILVVLLLILLPLGAALYRARSAGYRVEHLQPERAYRVRLGIYYKIPFDSVRVRAYLPKNEEFLSLGGRWTDTDLINSAERYFGGNRQLVWWGETERRGKVETSFTVITNGVSFDISRRYTVPGPPDDRTLPFLSSTETIQADAPAIDSLAQKFAPPGSRAERALRRIHLYCAGLREPPPRDPRLPPRPEDALSVLKKRSGSDLGRSRLFAALARQSGFPTRLVHGILLDPSHDQTPTTWVEVWLGSCWVPFHPSAGLFARTDGRLVPFCRGDVALVEIDPPVQPRIRCQVERTFAVRGRLIEGSPKAGLTLLGVWGALEESGVSVEMIYIVLLLPFGAFVAVLLRNLIGLNTLGFLLPMLISVGALHAGLLWGIISFLFVLGTVFTFRMVAGPLRLLHYPRLAAALTATVIAITGLAGYGALTGNISLARVTFLPLVVLTVATEQFAQTLEEEGPLKVLNKLGTTLIAIALTYFVMSNYRLQGLVLTFPESVCIIICLDIVFGRWTGLRLTEYWRFRSLSLTKHQEA